MSQVEKAKEFHDQHHSENPLLLYNIWDAGGAIALAKAGAKAIATGSWSVAAAHGFPDGESMPLDFILRVVDRIAQATNLPLTVDFEGGYAETPAQVAANVRQLIKAGPVGINFEDQVVNGSGLYSVSDQVARIQAVRDAADEMEVPLFINARTDLFLKASSVEKHPDLIKEALERETAYVGAGANCFFVPGLTELDLIGEVCKQSSLPVNVMMMGSLHSIQALKQLGVSRISFGPKPYIDAIEDLTARFTAL
jgi:2-methylisocitrate lyase-like PEP mutase family enzyme